MNLKWGMKIAYYPGCTLKTRAKNLEDTAISSLELLGFDIVELQRWNCCGAVYSLADDDLIHQVAPVRILIRAVEEGCDKLLTLCSMCYNTLARANLLMTEEEEKRGTLNDFMDEEKDYSGEVRVYHLLSLLRDEIGWDKVREKVKNPLNGLKVAPYYGCTLLRPKAVSIEKSSDNPKIMHEFLEAIGVKVVDFPSKSECCGSYNIVSNPEIAYRASHKILQSAKQRGAELLVSSCPLCEYNLGLRQSDLSGFFPGFEVIPTLYFTQLLAIAFGLGVDVLNLGLNEKMSGEFLKEKNLY